MTTFAQGYSKYLEVINIDVVDTDFKTHLIMMYILKISVFLVNQFLYFCRKFLKILSNKFTSFVSLNRPVIFAMKLSNRTLRHCFGIILNYLGLKKQFHYCRQKLKQFFNYFVLQSNTPKYCQDTSIQRLLLHPLLVKNKWQNL